jgi:hypothetical protein
MITNDKIIEIFCATDEFSKKYEEEIENMPLLSSEGKVRRRRAASMSDSEIMTILIMFQKDRVKVLITEKLEMLQGN